MSGSLKRKSSPSEHEAKKQKTYQAECYTWSLRKDNQVIDNCSTGFLSFKACKDDAERHLGELNDPSLYAYYDCSSAKTITMGDLSKKTYEYLLRMECFDLIRKRNTAEFNENSDNVFIVNEGIKRRAHLKISIQRLYEATQCMMKVYRIADPLSKMVAAETLRKIELASIALNKVGFESEFDALREM